jgi:hypothetical protein
MTQQVRRSEKDVQRELERIERFRKVASHRANKALTYIEALIRTSDRARYSYNDDQVAEILSKLNQAIDQLTAAYSGQRQASLRVEL